MISIQLYYIMSVWQKGLVYRNTAVWKTDGDIGTE